MSPARRRWTFGQRWRFDPEIEALLALRETDQGRWEALKPHLKLLCAFYEGYKANADEPCLPVAVEGARESASDRKQALGGTVASADPVEVAV